MIDMSDQEIEIRSTCMIDMLDQETHVIDKVSGVSDQQIKVTSIA